MKRVLVAESSSKLVCEDGSVLAREYGNAPNGEPLQGCWVLRDPNGTIIDYGSYRNDITERHGFTIQYHTSFGS